MLQLLYDPIEKNANPTFPVRWCIAPSDIALLQQKGANHIYVLIVVRYENGREDRQCLPFEEYMTYISLRYPGKHFIFACLVWLSGYYANKDNALKDALAMRDTFLRKSSHHCYEREVLWQQRSPKPDPEAGDSFWGEPVQVSNEWYIGFRAHMYGIHSGRTDRLDPAEPIEIEVPKEFFAKEPPEWLQRWVNGWYSYPPVDQCQFRRRAIFAFLVQPLIVSIQIIWFCFWRILFATVLLFLGMRDISFTSILHPFHDELDDLWNTEFGNWFFTSRSGQKWHRCFIPVYPPFVAVYLGIIRIVALIQHRTFQAECKILAQAIVGSLAWLFTNHTAHVAYRDILNVVIAVGLVWLLTWLITQLVQREKRAPSKLILAITDWQTKHREIKLQRELEADRLARKLAQTETERMWDETRKFASCSTIPKIPSLESLPPEKRTVHLRFLDLKRKVCKPFAG
jgi:hypothetical protein